MVMMNESIVASSQTKKTTNKVYTPDGECGGRLEHKFTYCWGSWLSFRVPMRVSKTGKAFIKFRNSFGRMQFFTVTQFMTINIFHNCDDSGPNFCMAALLQCLMLICLDQIK